MKPILLDTNLLIALIWPTHIHHHRVTSWFAANRAKGWATCPIVEAGFVRIVSNPAFSRDALNPAQATQLLSQNTTAQDHHFWKDDISFPKAVRPFAAKIVGHQQVTDAYLWGLALNKGGLFATMDKSAEDLVEPRSPLRKSLHLVGI